MIFFSWQDVNIHKKIVILNKTFSSILTVIMFLLTVFRDSKQKAVDLFIKMRDFIEKNDVFRVCSEF